MMYSTIFHTFTSICGYIMCKGEDWFPKTIGGHGDAWKLFDKFPYPPKIYKIEEYYMWILGWHLEGFLKMIILDGLGPDVIEMSLHHLVTAYLVAGSFLINLVRLGVCVELIHDFTDILNCIARGLSETRYRTASYIAMAINLSFWCYARLFAFSHLIYVTHNSDIMSDDNSNKYIIQYIVYGLSTLVILHFWQAKTMFSKVYTAFTRAKVEDATYNFQNKKGPKNHKN